MPGDPVTHSVEDVHRTALRRSEALVLLRDGPMTRATLQERLDVSKSTAYRTTTTLAEHGFVERRDSEYVLTAAGDAAAERAEAFCRTVTAMQRVDPLFELVDREALDLDPALFDDAVVTHATRSQPYGPHRRFWSVVGDATRLRLLYNTVHAPEAISRYVDVVAAGLDLTVVYDPETVWKNLDAIEEHHPGLLAADGVEVRVGADSFGGGVAITEDRVGVMGHDPTKGTPVVAVDTDDPAALEWGDALFERHYAASESVDPSGTR